MKKKITHHEAKVLTDIPSIGKMITRDFYAIGVKVPGDLVGKDALALFHSLEKVTKKRHDPCVLDTFMAAVSFMNGGGWRDWYSFTSERKKKYPHPHVIHN